MHMLMKSIFVVKNDMLRLHFPICTTFLDSLKTILMDPGEITKHFEGILKHRMVMWIKIILFINVLKTKLNLDTNLDT